MVVRHLTVAALSVCIVFALAGCRKEEQDRFVVYEPGVYKGKPDQELTVEQKRAIKNRTLRQAGIGVGGRPVNDSTGDVRPPE